MNRPPQRSGALKEGRAPVNRRRVTVTERLTGWTAAEESEEIDKAKVRAWDVYSTNPTDRCPAMREADYQTIQQILQTFTGQDDVNNEQNALPSTDCRVLSSPKAKLDKICEDEPNDIDVQEVENQGEIDIEIQDEVVSIKDDQENEIPSPPPSIPPDDLEQEFKVAREEVKQMPVRLSYTQANITLRRPYPPNHPQRSARSSTPISANSAEGRSAMSDNILNKCWKISDPSLMGSWFQRAHLPLTPPHDMRTSRSESHANLPTVLKPPSNRLQPETDSTSQGDSGYSTENQTTGDERQRENRAISDDRAYIQALQKHYFSDLPRSRRTKRSDDNQPSAQTDKNMLSYEETLFLLREGMQLTKLKERQQSFLGPPPFKAQTAKTPFHRARENSQKRLFNQLRLNDFTPSHLSGFIDTCLEDSSRSPNGQLFQRNPTMLPGAHTSAISRIEEEFQSAKRHMFRLRLGSAHFPVYLPGQEGTLRTGQMFRLRAFYEPPSQSMRLYQLSKKKEGAKGERSMVLGSLRSENNEHGTEKQAPKSSVVRRNSFFNNEQAMHAKMADLRRIRKTTEAQSSLSVSDPSQQRA